MRESDLLIGDNVSSLTDREVTKVIRDIGGANLLPEMIIGHLDLLTRSAQVLDLNPHTMRILQTLQDLRPNKLLGFIESSDIVAEKIASKPFPKDVLWLMNVFSFNGLDTRESGHYRLMSSTTKQPYATDIFAQAGFLLGPNTPHLLEISGTVWHPQLQHYKNGIVFRFITSDLPLIDQLLLPPEVDQIGVRGSDYGRLLYSYVRPSFDRKYRHCFGICHSVGTFVDQDNRKFRVFAEDVTKSLR